MTHNYPVLLASSLTAPPSSRAAAAGARATSGSWKYPRAPGKRGRFALALLLSAALHGAIFLSVRKHPPKPKAVDDTHLIAVKIAMPDLKELEEPEKVVRDDTAEPLDPAEYAPTLTDAPQIVLPNSFVQELNFASLIPPPDLSQAKVFVIPHNILRTTKLGEGLGNIFSLAELDQHPQPVVQPSPVFPPQLKREVSEARVVVEFVVDTEGRVHTPFAVESTHDGFNDAACAGVARWRFRPGIRNGIRVNTRMSVPILFKVSDPDN